VAGQRVSKADKVVKMLATCKRIRDSREQKEIKLKKLVERINLDRPILQKEKIDLILLEKGSKDDLTVSQIRSELIQNKNQRRQQNEKNRKAVMLMLEYVKKRSHTENLIPQTEEIQILEVFKKLSESGWTVDVKELK
jgi:tRNA splicing endonuclease